MWLVPHLGHSVGGFAGLYIELKRQKGGKVSKAQEDVIAMLRRAGYRVEVCSGWWEARDVIERYLDVMPQRSITA